MVYTGDAVRVGLCVGVINKANLLAELQADKPISIGESTDMGSLYSVEFTGVGIEDLANFLADW